MKVLKKLSLIVTIVLVILTFFSEFSFAVNSEVAVVSSESEIEALLGTTSNKEREKSLLGLAGRYSVFVEDDFTIRAAETGGRAAVGGQVDAKTNYKYQFGSGEYNYQSATHSGIADLVVGEGPIKNVETQYGSTISGNCYDMNKKIVVSEDSSSMNWSDYSADELNNFVQSNAIDFDDEFEYLRGISTEIKSYSPTGSVSNRACTMTSSFDNATPYTSLLYGEKFGEHITFFSGRDKFVNIFTVSASQWNGYETIVFDVPYNSYVIVNVTGDNVEFDGSTSLPYAQKNIFYPISRVEIAEKGLNQTETAYFSSTGTPPYSAMCSYKDDEGYVKTYVKLLNKSESQWDKGEYLLFNLPDATSFTIKSNWIGTILAPNANGSDSGKNDAATGRTICGGHLAGGLICKSYDGYQEFGTTYFSMPKEYLSPKEVNIEKINSKTGENLVGAKLKLSTTDGNTLYTWTTENTAKTVSLVPGTYIISEISAPDMYDSINPVAIKVDKSGNCTVTTTSYKDIDEKCIIRDDINDNLQNTSTSQMLSNMLVSAIKEEEQNPNVRINKMTFVTDTTSATTLPDYGLYCTVAGLYNQNTYPVYYYEDLPWKYTKDGELVTAYLHYSMSSKDSKGVINFYRGSQKVGDVKARNIKLYYDEFSPKSVTQSDLKNAEVNSNNVKLKDDPNQGFELTVVKKDKEDGSSIEGAKFGIYTYEDNDLYSKDELIAEGTTNENGVVELKRYLIPAGKYYLKEISAAPGYVTEEYYEEFEVTDTLLKKEYNVENTKIKDTTEVQRSDFSKVKAEEEEQQEEQQEEKHNSILKTGDTIIFSIIMLLSAILVLTLVMKNEKMKINKSKKKRRK